MDLSKAFDTVDHKILISKLKNYGVRGKNLKWFESYFNNRKQFVSYNNKYTSFETIACGVPQGLILGSLLFLIYINDLNQVSNILDPMMFADDTIFFYSHHQIKTLLWTKKYQPVWFRANKLSLNIKKSKIYIMFYQRQNSFKIANIKNRKQRNRKNTIHKILRSDVG